MEPELEKKIVNRFDFFQPKKPLQESLMAFGFACHDGWFNLIWELSEAIEKELENDPEIKKDFEVIQVKEKFGGLRFYTNLINDKIFKLIDEYEKKSEETCERCGKRGFIRNDIGWFMCLCDKHYKDLKERRKEKLYKKGN
jgi:hypothetical protein